MYLFIIFILFFLSPTTVNSLTTAPVDITNMNIYEIQEAVDNGYINYEKIINIYLERINKYNAVLTINKNAVKEAKKLDIEYKKNGRKSLIHGLPILVKDNIDVVGMPTTAGTKALLDSYPKKNASAVQKLIDAGAIIIGKTNMSTLALSGTSSFSSFGHVRNAYNTAYSPYGSSGGSAVGVAAGFAVAAIGTETGVSIRLPASANNVIGFRTTYGIIDTTGIIHLDSTRDVIGPITRYIEDNAILLEILSGDNINYQSALVNDSVKGLRIGVVKDIVNTANYNIKNLFNNNIKQLKKAGAEIVYINSLNLEYTFLNIEMCYDFNQYIIGTNSTITSFEELLNSKKYTGNLNSYLNDYCNINYSNSKEYSKYLQTKKKNIDKANKIFENNKLDAIVYPTVKNPIVKLDNLYNSVVKTNSSRTANLIGFPSLNTQMGFINNLPYGMEIMSQTYNESIIYNIAYNLQTQKKHYELPKISPSLYKVSDSTKTKITFNYLIKKLISYIPQEIKLFIKKHFD